MIHDLRVQCNGRVAQADHLLIDRFLEIYVVESKSFRTKIRHAYGGWERLNFNRWKGIPARWSTEIQEEVPFRRGQSKRLGRIGTGFIYASACSSNPR